MMHVRETGPICEQTCSYGSERQCYANQRQIQVGFTLITSLSSSSPSMVLFGCFTSASAG